MLDLLYTGHEDLAWKYLDLVWPVNKVGKERFLSDFKARLAESYFWQLMEEEKEHSLKQSVGKL
jgi:hypothetical protein